MESDEKNRIPEPQGDSASEKRKFPSARQTRDTIDAIIWVIPPTVAGLLLLYGLDESWVWLGFGAYLVVVVLVFVLRRLA